MKDYSPDGAAGDSLRELEEIYADLDRRAALFARQANLSCPKGCGTCCCDFEPDITDTEAAYVALYLLTKAPALIDRLTAVVLQQSCVFYEPGGIYHCSIYGVRPLVCRAFGFAASTEKKGRPHFAGCKLMPGAKGAASKLHEPASFPPLMPEYGVCISALSSGARSAMRSGVLRAITSVGLKMRLSSLSATGLPSPDSDRPPEGEARRSGAA